jgi:hypothetical protein
MSSPENKSLEDWVRKWADGNDAAYNYWVDELSGPPHFITSIQTLEEVASGSAWLDFFKRLSPSLRTKLEKWHEEKYKSSKSLILCV